MALTEQAESKRHGDAWWYFCRFMRGRQYGEEELRAAWLWFLEVWLAKAKQQQELKSRR